MIDRVQSEDEGVRFLGLGQTESEVPVRGLNECMIESKDILNIATMLHKLVSLY